MADITAPTLTGDFAGFLPAAMSAPIFEQAKRTSVVQQLARQVPLGSNGQSVPVVTGKIQAGWVAEGGRKPTSKGSMSLKTITPHKLAAIAVVSAEVVRANPGGYVQDIQPQMAEAFATAFDAAALHGTSTPFAAFIDQTTKAVELGAHTGLEGGVWQDLVSALRLLVEDGKRLTGFALDDTAEPALLGSVDGNGRPLFIEDAAAALAAITDGTTRRGSLMGRPFQMTSGVAGGDGTVGYAGDWSQVAWGVVGGISYDISTQASVTIDGELVSLWENNLVAIRGEAEFGFLVNDVSAFVRIENDFGS